MKNTVFFILISAVLILSNCSSTHSVYVSDKYKDNPGSMIKKVIVAVNVPKDYPELAPLISNIAADIIKLRTNYIVYEYKTIQNGNLDQLCRKDIEGIFLFSIQHAEIKKTKIQLDLKSELINCSNKELLWKIQASEANNSDNPDLKELTAEYEEKFKNSAPIFAAPAFIIIQDIIESVPNPELTDAEVDLKIKLDAKK